MNLGSVVAKQKGRKVRKADFFVLNTAKNTTSHIHYFIDAKYVSFVIIMHWNHAEYTVSFIKYIYRGIRVNVLCTVHVLILLTKILRKDHPLKKNNSK